MSSIRWDVERDPTGRAPTDPGAKLDDGKLMADVLTQFPRALKAVAEVGDFGARKYSWGGWLSVPNAIRRYTAAKWRHLLDGCTSDMDPQSGLRHLAHEAWNVLAVLELTLAQAAQSDEPNPEIETARRNPAALIAELDQARCEAHRARAENDRLREAIKTEAAFWRDGAAKFASDAEIETELLGRVNQLLALVGGEP